MIVSCADQSRRADRRHTASCCGRRPCSCCRRWRSARPRRPVLMIWVRLAGTHRATVLFLIAVGCDRSPPIGCAVGFGAALFCVAGRRVSTTTSLGGVSMFFLLIMLSALLRRRRLCGDRAIRGRGLAGAPARERHGLRLWPRQFRQDHRTARAGADRGLVQLRQSEGRSCRAWAGDELSCGVERDGWAGIPIPWFRDKGRSLEEIDEALLQPKAAKVWTAYEQR